LLLSESVVVGTPINVSSITIQGPQGVIPRQSIQLTAPSLPAITCFTPIGYIWESNSLLVDDWSKSGQSITVDESIVPYDGGALEFSLYGVYNRTGTNNSVIILLSSLAFAVKASEPVVVITGPSAATTVVGSSFVIDLSQSYDPEGTNKSSWNFSCTCQAYSGSCSSVSASITVNNITLTASVPGLYSINIQLNIGSRSANATFVFQVTQDASAVPQVNIVSSIGSIANLQNQLVLEAQVNQLVPSKQITFQWSAYKLVNGAKISLNSTTFFATSISQPKVAIRPQELEISTQYMISLSSWFNGSSGVSSLFTIFSTGAPPNIGTFIVSPNNGISLSTQFNLYASNWSSNNGNTYLKYSFEYFNEKSQQYEVMASFINSITPAVSLVLPPGSKSSNNLPLALRVTDIYGNEAVQYQTVNVLPLGSNVNLLQVLQSQLTDIIQEMLTDTNAVQQLSVIASMLDPTIEGMQSLQQQLLSTVGNAINAGGAFSASDAISLLSLITSQTTLLDSSSINTSLNQLINLLQGYTNGIPLSMINSTANLLSNCFNGSNELISEQFLNATKLFASKILQDLLPSEAPIIVQAPKFHMILLVTTGANAVGNYTTMNGNQVQILESSVLNSYYNQDVGVQIVTFNGADDNPYEWASSDNPSSTILEFQLTDINGNKIPLDNVGITLVTSDQNNTNQQVCKFFNEKKAMWDTFGCRVGSLSKDFVTCLCNHTTSFASFILYDSSVDNNTPYDVGAYIFSIIYSIVFMIISLGLLTYCFIMHQRQPLKSRFIAPYIGLTAIIVESILQGIIRNSLLLAPVRYYKALNALSYLITTTVNPLNLMALFVFTWQMARYMLLRHVYNIIDIAPKTTVLIFKALTSKLLYGILAALVAIAVFIYYFISSLVIGIPKGINVKAATTFQSASYMAMAFALAILITILFFADFIVNVVQEVKTMKTKHEGSRNSNEGLVNPQKEKSAAHLENIVKFASDFFGSNDPLKFRIDSLVMMIAVAVIMPISYIIGFYQLFDSTKSPGVIIVTSVFDMLHIALKIIAFAGSVSIFTVLQSLPSSRIYLLTPEEVIDSSETSKLISSVLLDPVGYQYLAKFAKAEFSVENLIFWTELNKLIEIFATLSSTDRFNSLEQLHKDFIADRSIYEVNLEAALKKAAKIVIAKGEEATIEEGQKLLKKLYNGVLTNISDTFCRFSNTKAYTEYLEAKKMTATLIELGMQ
jgi:hypothetical protein